MSERRRKRQRQPSGPRERVTLQLTGVAHGGEALGRHEGRVFFVPYGLPGETVTVEIVQDKSDYARGEIVEILEAAPERVTARCAYFGSCGGCQWQHATYEAQLGFKRQIVAEQLRRIGHFEDAESLVLPTIGMAEPWHYRNHARFTVGRRFGELCFTRSGTRQLLRIEHCWLMQPPIDALLARLQRRLPGFRAHQLSIRVGANTGDILVNPGLPDLVDPIPVSEDEQARFGGSTVSPDRPSCLGVAPEQPVDEYAALWPSDEIPSGQTELYEELLGRRFRVAAPAFFQVNTGREQRGPAFPTTEIVARFGGVISPDGLSIAETLVLLGLDRLDMQPHDVVVDAYCGVGTFAAVMSPFVGAVIGIEESPAAVKDAGENCADLPNTRFIAGKVEDVLPKLEERPTKVLLDPARVGCERPVLDALIAAELERIVYVSCEPATLARDLAILREGGYRLQSVQPLDMFPQTYHVECVALLTR
ncbi:MAG: class I SAM-dependent RNA methyltransferase [Chloroflexi bacterium]|nr:class I SAM-dependent RNA methyltransferase [Chloroflexota bacterium]